MYQMDPDALYVLWYLMILGFKNEWNVFYLSMPYTSCKVKTSMQERERTSVHIYRGKSEVPWGIQTLIPLWFLSPPTSSLVPGPAWQRTQILVRGDPDSEGQLHSAHDRVLQNPCTYRWQGIICVQSSHPSCPWNITPNCGFSLLCSQTSSGISRPEGITAYTVVPVPSSAEEFHEHTQIPQLSSS